MKSILLALTLYALVMPTVTPAGDIPGRLGGGNLDNGRNPAKAAAKLEVLQKLGAGMCRVPVSANDYWTGKEGTPHPERLDNLVKLAHSHGVTPIFLFEYYTRYGGELGGHDKWFKIGKAFAERFKPDSDWLRSQDIHGWGVTFYSAINEPEWRDNNPAPIPPEKYAQALEGLADGVHAAAPGLHVNPGGYQEVPLFSRKDPYLKAVAPLFNSGKLFAIGIHRYWDVDYVPMAGKYNFSLQSQFEQVKRDAGITADVRFYTDEINFKKRKVSEEEAAQGFLTALWDALGVTGGRGQVVSQFVMPWNIFNLTTQDGSYGLCTELSPWTPTARGRVLALVCELTRGLDFTSADPKGSGEYILEGGGRKLWVWQNRKAWTNHPGSSLTVEGIPASSGSLQVYAWDGLKRSLPVSGSTMRVEGLSEGQTWMILAVPDQPAPAKPLVPQATTPFTAAQVRLLDGMFKDSQDAEAKYLLTLDLDRLLAPYRAGAGLPAKAKAYPGWETNTLPGVGLAFYLSGMSRLYASTGQAEYGRRIKTILDELEACQAQCGGYLLGTTHGRAIMARVEREGYFKGFSPWSGGEATPYYSMEKLFSGLRDAWRLCHERKALQIAIALGDWLEGHMSHLSDKQLQSLMTAEFGGMNWVLADLYADTGDVRYLAMSKRWQHRWLTDALAQGRDELGGKHANAQFPKISGLAARYPYSGDAADLNTARFFWESVVRHHSYATGGNSESEYFGAPDQLGDQLTPFTEENCNVYNMLRLTALLARVEPRAQYAEYCERALYNHILAAQHRESGGICYFLPLMPGARKKLEPLHTLFSCCVCSAMDSYVRHGEYIYSHSAQDLYVNLFIASEVDWADKGVKLRQETRFPEQDVTTLRFTCAHPAEFGLNLRYPAWATRGMTVRINGAEQKLDARPGEFVRITRTWQNGDVVQVKILLSLRTEDLPGAGGRIALFYGPILLAGEVPVTAGWTHSEDDATPVLVPDALPVEQWLTPGAEVLTFKTTIARPAQVTLKPFYAVTDEGYTVYWEKLSREDWAKRETARAKRAEELRDREARTMDRVIVGDGASETAHAFKGNTEIHQGHGFLLPGRSYRFAGAGKSFAYTFKVPAGRAAQLVCTFIGREAYPVTDKLSYRIMVDGTALSFEKQTTDRSFTNGLYEKVISIAPQLTAGKSAVEVKFEADAGGKTASLVELRMVGK